MDVRLKRAYAPPAAEDGLRVLVDRIWPRGLRKSDAAINKWMKEVAPTTNLRRWFAHDPDRWNEFRRRYRAELADNAVLVNELRELAHKGTVTLIYAARDELHNQAVVLRDVVLTI